MNTRHIFEHHEFQDLFMKDPVRVINKLTQEKSDYVFKLLKKTYENKNEICPYTLMDIDVTFKSLQGFDFITIKMPENGIEAGNCHEIIILSSFYLNLFQYYVVEEGYNPKYGRFKSLGAWMEDAHISLGDLDKSDTDIYATIISSLSL